jgi:hypothetical protein
VSTGNLTPSERRRLGYEDMVLLEARRKKWFHEQCDRSSSEDEDNGIEDDEESDIEDDQVNIMNGLENNSKELADDSSDSDCKEYEFQEEQQQIKVAEKKEDFTINKWRSLKCLNPQGMDLNVWLSIHFEKGFDATENMQRNDIRVLESKEKAHRRLWKWRDDNGVMHPDEIEEVFRMDKKKLTITEYRGNDKKARSCKQGKRTS